MLKAYKEAKSNIILGAASLAFAVFYYAATYTFRLRKVANSVNAAFFPRIIGVLVAVCALAVLIRGIRQMKQVPKEERRIPEEERRANRSGMLRILEVFLVLLAVAILLKPLGFLLTTPWMMFLLFCILEKKEKRNYLQYAIISLIAPIITFLIFFYGFSTMLPMGFLRRTILTLLS